MADPHSAFPPRPGGGRCGGLLRQLERLSVRRAFITQHSLYTAGLAIATFSQEGDIQLYQLEAAGVVFSILPVALYLAVQRHVVRGLTAGAVK